MVYGTSYGVSAMASAAATINAPKSRITPVFSTASHLTSAATASVKRSGPVTHTPSQVNSAASNFRQLFGGSAAVAVATPIAAPQFTTPANPPFVPSFRTATITDGRSVWPLNSTYFASKDTAQWIANKYGTGQVFET